MGMFDNISVSDALPYSDEMKELGLNVNNYTFQTKDLDCLMDTYIIQSGKLFIQKYKTSTWIEGDKNAKSVMDRIGYTERTDPYYEEVPHHGEIYFYEFLRDVQDKWDCWVEFKATFTTGQLTGLELFKFEKKDNTERKQSEKEWAEKLKREQALWYNKYFLHTKAYRWFSRQWYRLCQAIGNFFHKISYKL